MTDSSLNLRRLEKLGYLKNREYIELIDDLDYTMFLKEDDQVLIYNFYNDYKNIKGKKLISVVYSKYPYFASKSKIKNEIFGKKILSF